MNVKKCFATQVFSLKVDLALLFIRIVWGLAMAFHGWGKIQAPFNWMGDAGASVPGFLQGLAALAEFGGGIAMILGLLFPLAGFGLACTMLVATCLHAFILHDPFVASGQGGGSYEMALVYLCISLLFLATGPGKYAIDRKIFGTK